MIAGLANCPTAGGKTSTRSSFFTFSLPLKTTCRTRGNSDRLTSRRTPPDSGCA